MSPVPTDKPADSRASRLHPVWSVIGWALVLTVVWFSISPTPPKTELRFGDKLHHLSAYFTLAAWWIQLGARHLRVFAAFVALGAALEVVQGFTGYRQASLLDLAANTLGVTLGWLVSRQWPRALAGLDARLRA